MRKQLFEAWNIFSQRYVAECRITSEIEGLIDTKTVITPQIRLWEAIFAERLSLFLREWVKAFLLVSKPEPTDDWERYQNRALEWVRKQVAEELAEINEFLTEHLEISFSLLQPREALVLRHRFGFEGEPKNLEETGKVFEVTRERVRQIEAKALRKLRHPSVSTWELGGVVARHYRRLTEVIASALEKGVLLSPAEECVVALWERERRAYQKLEEETDSLTKDYEKRLAILRDLLLRSGIQTQDERIVQLVPGIESAPIGELGLDSDTQNALVRGGIRRIGQLAALSRNELGAIRGIGKTRINRIKGALAKFQAKGTSDTS